MSKSELSKTPWASATGIKWKGKISADVLMQWTGITASDGEVVTALLHIVVQRCSHMKALKGGV